MISYLVFTCCLPKIQPLSWSVETGFELPLKTHGFLSSVWSFRHSPPAHTVGRSDLASRVCDACSRPDPTAPAPTDVQKSVAVAGWKSSGFVFELVFCVWTEEVHAYFLTYVCVLPDPLLHLHMAFVSWCKNYRGLTTGGRSERTRVSTRSACEVCECVKSADSS